MTFPQFANEWVGKRVDFDGSYGYQCVDLIRQWLKESEGTSNTGGVSYAFQYWTNTPSGVSSVVDKVNWPSTLQPGDILPLTDASGRETSLSHIMIASGNTMNGLFEGLEQNGSTGGGSGYGADAIRFRYVTQSRILGILRPKNLNPTPAPTPSNGKRVYLPAVPSWRVYRTSGPYDTSHAIGALAPGNYGGLNYAILGYPVANVVIIQTQTYGQVAIYVGPGTGAVIQ